MATKPGFLTDWPWKGLGSFKYAIMAPWVAQSMYWLAVKPESERDLTNLLILPFLLWRMLHNQLWISFSRHRTAKGNNRIVDKSIEFEQVDRESNWDDQILLNGILLYIFNMASPGAAYLPIWRTKGVVIMALLHVGPVEFLYYWLHRALHHHYLYSRYHSHHHSSIVTEPITCKPHLTWRYHISYFLLFAIPMLTTVFTGTASIASMFGYVTYIDLMNNMGHCNFELIPHWLFSVFPLLKYMMYTPSYHSLHHTQFRTNYSLFMPIYDYIYGTMDKSTDALHETALERKEDTPDVVHLTHLTTPDSIYHLRLGLASIASNPHLPRCYLWLLWPVTFWSMIVTCLYGHTFIEARNSFKNLRLQSWAIPRYNTHYLFKWQREAINGLIEEAIIEAEAAGSKVLSLGLLNQASFAALGEELNRNGELYIQKYPDLKVKVVNGSSLAVAIVLNTIPKGTTQVLLRGKLSKVACSIASALCQKGIQVVTLYKDEYEKLKLSTMSASTLLHSRGNARKIWLVGDGLSIEEQQKAPKGTLFIPYSPLPPKRIRKDCFYHYTPAMSAPTSLQNLHSCEVSSIAHWAPLKQASRSMLHIQNWLPRRVMSAWRVAGIIHALEGWNEHECGDTVFNVEKVWQASLKHGFRPLLTPN
ncbi:hypothetical protein RJ639_005597 [Escallonia herrerae]|uniref:Protein ECERIFERUM 1-like n=1 Tax=Escallonia herrerae TaxID=1293975 RepID=A0AA88W0F9_9ASTE|nr:hypothetical protein RJ639_005597 [Escallonia herrerae]